MYRNIQSIRPEPTWQRQAGLRRQINVKYLVALIAIKVAMFRHIRTKVCGAPVQRYLPDQSTSHQRIEAIINCRHRDLRHLALGPHKDSIGSRMIALMQQNRVHVLALRREAKAAGRQPLVQTFTLQFFPGNHFHGEGTLTGAGILVNIWNNSKY